MDNNSSDGTSKFCHDFLEKANMGNSWKVVLAREPGLSNARKAGVLNSKYEYVIFCDDDNWFNPDFVQLAYTLMEEKPDTGVLGGLGIPELEGAKPLWFDAYAKSYAVGPQALSSGVVQGNAIIYGAGMIIRKSVLIDLFDSGFDSLLSDRKGTDLVSGGDNEICLWYRYLGYKIIYDEHLSFKHYIPSNRLTKNYLLKRATGKGKTEAIFNIYSSLFRREKKVKWIESYFYWNVEVFKRLLLLLLFSITPFTFERKLSRNVLWSSIIFRLFNKLYLKQCSIKLIGVMSKMRKMDV